MNIRNRYVLCLLAGFLFGCLLTYFVGGRYYYTKQGAQIVRINKISSRASVWVNGEWVDLKAFNESLPKVTE